MRPSNKNAAEKRKREIERQKWQAEKAERRLQRQQGRQERAAMGDEEDPDIAGIVPGPQLPPPVEAPAGASEAPAAPTEQPASKDK